MHTPWTTSIETILHGINRPYQPQKNKNLTWRLPPLWVPHNEYISRYNDQLLFLTLEEPAGVILATPTPETDSWAARLWLFPSTVREMETALFIMPFLIDTPPKSIQTIHAREVPYTKNRDPLISTDNEENISEQTLFVLNAFREVLHKTKLDDINTYIQKYFPTLTVERADGFFPFQATGMWDGYKFYFRSKYGDVTLDIGKEDAIKEPYWEAEAIMPGIDSSMYGIWEEKNEKNIPILANIGSSLGEITIDNFLPAFLFLALHLKKSPFLYFFEIIGQDKPQGIRAYTAEEAYTLLSSIKEERLVNPTPTNMDRREFPLKHPHFLDKHYLQKTLTSLNAEGLNG